MKQKKTIISLTLVIVAACIGYFFYNKYNAAPKIDIVKLNVVNEDTIAFDFATLKGKKVIVSFYASWCPGCLQELKALNAIYNQKLADVVVLAITDESIEKLVEFKNKKKYPFTFLTLTGNFNDIGVFSIPTMYLLNSKGEQVYENVGFVDWEDVSTFNYLNTLLNE